MRAALNQKRNIPDISDSRAVVWRADHIYTVHFLTYVKEKKERNKQTNKQTNKKEEEEQQNQHFQFQFSPL